MFYVIEKKISVNLWLLPHKPENMTLFHFFHFHYYQLKPIWLLVFHLPKKGGGIFHSPQDLEGCFPTEFNSSLFSESRFRHIRPDFNWVAISALYILNEITYELPLVTWRGAGEGVYVGVQTHHRDQLYNFASETANTFFLDWKHCNLSFLEIYLHLRIEPSMDS